VNEHAETPYRRFFAAAVALLGFHPLLRACWDPWSQALVIGVWAFFIALGGLLWMRRKYASSPEFGGWRPVLRSVRWPLGLYFGFSFLSACGSAFPHSAWPTLLLDLPAVAFFLLGAASASMEKSMCSILLVAVLGGLALIVAARRPEVLDPGGLLVNPNVFAAWAVLAWPLALPWVRSHRPVIRIAALGALAVIILSLGISRSFMGFLVIGVQCAAGGFWLWRRGRLRGILPVLAVLGLLAGGIFFRGDWTRLGQLESDRWGWWLSAARMIRQHPVFGVGPGAFGEAYPGYRVATWGLNSAYAHNAILELAAERGLPALGALVFLGALLVRRRRADRPESAPAVDARVALGVGLGGFVLYNQAHIGLSFPSLYWALWQTAGLLCASRGDVSSSTVERPRGVWILAGVGLWVAAAAASLAFFRSGQYRVAAQRAFAEGDATSAERAAERAIFWNRWEPQAYALRGALRAAAGEQEGAQADLDRAVALSPFSAGFRQDAAELARRLGDRAGALAHMDAATRFLPLNPLAWVRLAQLLKDEGRREDARVALASADRALADPRVLAGRAERRAALRKIIDAEKEALSGSAR
jgi:O-antigen ligase